MAVDPGWQAADLCWQAVGPPWEAARTSKPAGMPGWGMASLMVPEGGWILETMACHWRTAGWLSSCHFVVLGAISIRPLLRWLRDSVDAPSRTKKDGFILGLGLQQHSEPCWNNRTNIPGPWWCNRNPIPVPTSSLGLLDGMLLGLKF